MSTRKNGDLWRVAFVDVNGEPAAPESVVSWLIERNGRFLDEDGEKITPTYKDDGKVDLDTAVATTSEIADNDGTGVYLLTYTPQVGGPYSVKGWALVGGVWQAVPATRVEVSQ